MASFSIPGITDTDKLKSGISPTAMHDGFVLQFKEWF